MKGNTTMDANENAKKFYEEWKSIENKKYNVLLDQLKELGATKDKPIKFDWREQFAPCVVGECLEDDISDCYVKSIYADGDFIYVSLYGYYNQEHYNNIGLTYATHDWVDIIDYLVDWSWDYNFEGDDDE